MGSNCALRWIHTVGSAVKRPSLATSCVAGKMWYWHWWQSILLTITYLITIETKREVFTGMKSRDKRTSMMASVSSGSCSLTANGSQLFEGRFSYSHCTEAVRGSYIFWTIGTILDCSWEVANGGVHLRAEKSREMMEPGGRRYGTELSKVCMECRAIENLAEAKLHPGGDIPFKHQCLQIFHTSSKPQTAYNYTFLLMTPNQDVIGKIGDPGSL